MPNINLNRNPNIISVPADPRIIIFKSARRAELYDGARLIKTYRCALGGQPAGDKEHKGDQRTPEGTFAIVTRNSESRYHLFLGLSYPDAEDARRGLSQGLISEAEMKDIIQSDQEHRTPSWTTQLGGAIGLHGGGSASDWTAGCIAFDNADIAELWAATRIGTPVEIRP